MKSINIPLYNLILFFTTKQKEAELFAVNHDMPTSFTWPIGRAIARTSWNSGIGEFLITFNPAYAKRLTEQEIYAILAHEALHVVQGVNEMIQEDKIGDEVPAYLLQYICNFLFKEYSTLAKRNK